MKKVTLVVSILLGLMLIIFGLNKFMHFIPMMEMNEEAGNFMGALMNSAYMMPLIAIIEIITGIMIIINKYRALALVILFPVMLNALLFHIFLDPAGMGGALVAVVLNLYLAWSEKDKYASMLTM